MELSTLGALVTFAYFISIFTFQWFTDWYFNVSPSVILDSIHLALVEFGEDIWTEDEKDD
jgi:hypothetical protein